MQLLFQDTDLFATGKPATIFFPLPGAGLVLRECFFDKTAADCYYHALLNGTPWQQRIRQMYDKLVPDPRLTAWYYKSGQNKWPPDLRAILQKVEATCGINFDSVLLNYYRDGSDSVAWHSDTLPASGKHNAIASVTFGETRAFQIRHKFDKLIKQLEIPLRHGSFLLMGEQMQDSYEHHIPKTNKLMAPRINLTFRTTA
ncbi:MAG: alpha-ketoglutarate-dependent dioxygenase AlkB [Chitinophagaceae bacterium]